MPPTIRVLGIAGSLRRDSYNRAALRAAQRLAPDGMTIETYEGWGVFPLYNQDMEMQAFPDTVRDFKERIRAADGILIVTPEYNYGMPGGLKNAIDWASRPPGDSAWNGKPLAVMGAATGMGGSVRAQLQLRQSAIFLNMPVLLRPEVIIPMAREKFDAELNLTDEGALRFIREELAAFAQWIERLRRGQEARG